MRTTIRNVIEAKKVERAENGEAGFSLIELIVVVVILGILAAIAIPIFLNIQAQARQNAVNTVAGNAASQEASALAQNTTTTFTNFSNGGQYTFAVTPATGATTDNFCVTATDTVNTLTGKSGPGC